MGFKYGKDAIEAALAVLRRACADTFAGHIESASKPDEMDSEIELFSELSIHFNQIARYISTKE